MFLSVLELFKIGIGPSSSHATGPMVAAARFLDELRSLARTSSSGAGADRLRVWLHGSLAFTGNRHSSDRAVILGLCGEQPETVDLDRAEALLARVASSKRIEFALRLAAERTGEVSGRAGYRFDPATDLVLDKVTPLSGHANGMTFCAYDATGHEVMRRECFSIGGGFVVDRVEVAAL